MNVKLVEPYGFCAGVELVLKKINDIKKQHPNEKIFCVGQIVHNKEVISQLSKDGIIFLQLSKEEIIESLEKGVVVFSAHGTDENLIKKAKDKGLIVYDCVCPFVKKAFTNIKKRLEEDYDIIYVGVKNHDESNAALSISDNILFIEEKKDLLSYKTKNNKVTIINQTTLSQDDLQDIYSFAKELYPYITFENETCNSTTIRQRNLKKNIEWSDGVIVVGDKGSNNTKSLYKIAESAKRENAILVEKTEDINIEWVKSKKRVIIVSGASTPKEKVEEIYFFLKKFNKN